MGYSFTFKFSEKDIDFNPDIGNTYFDFNKFLINEFFKSNDSEMSNILREYQKVYGISSYNYLIKTYYQKWRNGNRTISNVQFERIVRIMPKLLNEEAKEKLSKIRRQIKYNHGKRQFLSTIKNAVGRFERNQFGRFKETKIISKTSELTDIFKNEYDEIKSYSYENIKTFSSSNNYLSDEELIEAIEISKYILEVKLQSLYDQIERDFQIFLPFIKNLKIGTFESSFKIEAFNIVVNLALVDNSQVRIPKFKIPEIESNNHFKKYSDKYLAYELVSINRTTKKQIANSFLNTNDLQVFLNHYNVLTNYDSEVSFDSNFLGESGELKIKARLVPPKMLKTSLLYSFIKLTVYITVTISLIALAVRNEAYILLLFGVFFVGIFAFTLIGEEIKEIRTLTKELKTYG